MQPILVVDELYVISDLHLGGCSGAQIFDQGNLVAAFITGLALTSPNQKLCLVINGDLVDFLAEPAATWFDPEGAVEKLERIASDPAFKPIFDALQGFTRSPWRHLAITLGNHDLELALPWVKERLLTLLSGDDPSARGRITLAFDGAGYRCRVRDAEVLCIHGNEVDAWNITDYEQLRRVGRDLIQGRTHEQWKPNAGSRMVVEVMNEIKAQHPFVDLLKPETQAVVPALMVLNPSLAGRIADIVKVALRMEWDKTRMRFGFLSAEDSRTAHEPGPEAVLRVLRGEAIGSTYLSGADLVPGANARDTTHGLVASRELLSRAEQQLSDGRLPLELIAAANPDDTLGWIGAAWMRALRRGDAEVMRAALDGLKADGHTFNLADADQTFCLIDQLVGPSLRFVIAGHTHLRRALERRRGGGFYYNTGTWARLIQILPYDLNDADKFRVGFEALKAKSLADLDRTGYVLRQPTAARVFSDTSGLVRGQLLDISLSAYGVSTFAPVSGSEFPRP